MKKGRLLTVTGLAIFILMFTICPVQAKEPYATSGDYGTYVVNKDSVPWTELVPGANSRLVWGDGIMVSFITMSPWTSFPRHSHGEQIMIVVDGYMDEMIDGKLYRVKKGDVIKLPANIPHGGYIYDVPCTAIDIFCPMRTDYIEKTKKQGTFEVIIPK